MRDTTPRLSDASVPTGAAAVGQMLREARESLGLDLAQVAEDTRIRLPFLEAIEDGRFGDLPGSAYAPAFLRGYAACVGLDVERVLQVYRSGDAPVVSAPAHHFPVVAPERRVPRGAMLLASVALLIGAYTTWHALTRDQMTQDVRVPPVPQRLLADQKPAASPGETPPATPPATAPAAAGPPSATSSASAPGAPPTLSSIPLSGPSGAGPAAPTAQGPGPAAPAATAQAPAAASPAAPPSPAAAGPAAATDTAAAQAPAARSGRGDNRAAAPADAAQGTGGEPKPDLASPPPAPAPAPATVNAQTAPAARPGQTPQDTVTATDTDPTQPNRVTSRAAPRPAAPPRPVPPPSTAGADAPPQQATAAPEPPRPAVKPRKLAGPPSPQPRTVRAEVDSTLELRSPTGEVLATTHVRAGTTYTVPEHVGYVLTPAER